MQPSLRKYLLSVAAVVIVASLGAVLLVDLPLSRTRADSGSQSAPPPPVAVSVAAVEAKKSLTWDEFSGRLEAIERVDVRSRVAGAVQAVHFREGSLVKQGDLLVTIDPAPYAAEVDRAQAQLVAAEARHAFTKSEVDRGQPLVDSRVVSPRDFDQRLNAYREADANLRAAKAALQSSQLNLDYTQVRAPVSGRVGRLEITVGNLVAAGPGAPVLTTLVSEHPIYASFNADEEIVGRALQSFDRDAGGDQQIGQIPVEATTAPHDGQPIQGRLRLIDNQVDARTGTVRVRAVFDNPDGRLMPGQFVRLRMASTKAAPLIAVNERAIGTDQNKKFVMVVGDGNVAAYREVSLGAFVDGLRVVTSGLSAGERVIVNGLQRVRPGAVVAPEAVSMDGQSVSQAQDATKAVLR
ncbi:MAG: efflux RND transporter periplasmic adaptor subunit [Sphingomonadales bacterium]|nr:efflux RND transporter periplasmic adaptor subunit [Sphingomonadales bacterium]